MCTSCCGHSCVTRSRSSGDPQAIIGRSAGNHRAMSTSLDFFAAFGSSLRRCSESSPRERTSVWNIELRVLAKRRSGKYVSTAACRITNTHCKTRTRTRSTTCSAKLGNTVSQETRGVVIQMPMPSLCNHFPGKTLKQPQFVWWLHEWEHACAQPQFVWWLHEWEHACACVSSRAVQTYMHHVCLSTLLLIRRAILRRTKE